MPKTNEELVEEFRRKFADENLWKDESGETAFVAIGNIEGWLLEALATKDTACEERVKKIEKAYGGCHYCYGKGYGTQTAAWEGRGYYKKLPTMKFCSCERGEQLKSLLTPPLPDQGDSK